MPRTISVDVFLIRLVDKKDIIFQIDKNRTVIHILYGPDGSYASVDVIKTVATTTSRRAAAALSGSAADGDSRRNIHRVRVFDTATDTPGVRAGRKNTAQRLKISPRTQKRPPPDRLCFGLGTFYPRETGLHKHGVVGFVFTPPSPVSSSTPCVDPVACILQTTLCSHRI